MITVNNNASNVTGMCDPRPEKWQPAPNRDIDSLFQQRADYNNSSKDAFDDLSKMFKQDAEFSQPVRQAVDSLMGELSGVNESVDDLLGQLVNDVKSGNPLSDLASPFSSDNPMSSEEMKEVVNAVISGLSSMSESTHDLLDKLEGSMRDAIDSPMSSGTDISELANAVLSVISGTSESADDLLGQLVDTVKAESTVWHLPDNETHGTPLHLPDDTIYILPPNVPMPNHGKPEHLPDHNNASSSEPTGWWDKDLVLRQRGEYPL
jgi:hypothetical protein